MEDKGFSIKLVKAAIIVMLILMGFRPLEAQEIRKGSDLSGIIVAPLDQGKIALASADKIFVSLDRPARIKVGDSLEIFQALSQEEKDQSGSFYRRVGKGTLLEIINSQLVLCVIDASLREVAVGDRIYFVSP